MKTSPALPASPYKKKSLWYSVVITTGSTTGNYHRTCPAVFWDVPQDSTTRSLPQEYHMSEPQEYHRSVPQEYHRSVPQEYHRSVPQEYHRSVPQEYHRITTGQYRTLPVVLTTGNYRRSVVFCDVPQDSTTHSLPQEYHRSVPQEYHRITTGQLPQELPQDYKLIPQEYHTTLPQEYHRNTTQQYTT